MCCACAINVLCMCNAWAVLMQCMCRACSMHVQCMCCACAMHGCYQNAAALAGTLKQGLISSHIFKPQVARVTGGEQGGGALKGGTGKSLDEGIVVSGNTEVVVFCDVATARPLGSSASFKRIVLISRGTSTCYERRIHCVNITWHYHML